MMWFEIVSIRACVCFYEMFLYRINMTEQTLDLSPEMQSPMVAEISAQIQEIEQIISNANTFKENYDDLNKRIIANINSSLKAYSRKAKSAVLIDAVELVIDGIDWDEMQNKLTQMLKSKKPNVSPHTWQRIKKPMISLGQMDDDPFINMFMNCSIENVKEFQKCRKCAREVLASTLEDVKDFEQELCQYRASIVDIIRSNVQALFDYHFNYVNDIYHKKQTASSVIIDGKTIPLKKSQKDFITSGLRELVVTQK